MTSRGRQWFMWMICYKKKKKKLSFFISSCSSSSVLLRSSRTCSQKNNACPTNMRSQCLNNFATEKKRQETNDVKLMWSQWKENNRPGSNSSCKYFPLCCRHTVLRFATENLPRGVWLVQQTSHPPLWLNQTKNYLLWLFDTGLHKNRDYKLLAAATSHVNQTNILITHTSSQNSSPLWIHLQDFKTKVFAVVQSIQPIN